jgi:hypothetical protein
MSSNTAQLRELEHIRHDILGDPMPLPPSTTALQKHQQPHQNQHQQSQTNLTSSSSSSQQQQHTASAKLKAGLATVRFVVRARAAAAKWAGHEQTRVRIARCVEEMKRQRRGQAFQLMHAK